MIKTYAPNEIQRLRDEVRGLTAAEEAGVSAPRILDVRENEMSVVMTRLPGAPVAHPGPKVDDWVTGLATQLVAIASAPAPTTSLPAVETWRESVEKRPAWVKDEGLWTAVQQRVAAGLVEGEPKFIHRDFHPLNVLWSSGLVSGVVDWEHACIGSIQFDISKCRVNVAAALDVDAADAFQRACGSVGADYDNAWDLETIVSLLGNVDILAKGNELDGRLTPDKVRTTFVELLRRAVA